MEYKHCPRLSERLLPPQLQRGQRMLLYIRSSHPPLPWHPRAISCRIWFILHFQNVAWYLEAPCQMLDNWCMWREYPNSGRSKPTPYSPIRLIEFLLIEDIPLDIRMPRSCHRLEVITLAVRISRSAARIQMSMLPARIPRNVHKVLRHRRQRQAHRRPHKCQVWGPSQSISMNVVCVSRVT